MAEPRETEKLKILRVIARLNIGGPALHVWTLSEDLSKHNFETTLVVGECDSGEKSYDEENQLKPTRFQLIRLKTMGRVVRGLSDLKTLMALIQIMRRERPQIVHTHTAKAGVLGRIAAWITGVPVVVHTFHGHVFRGYFSKSTSWLIQIIEKLFALGSSAIVTLSPALKNELVNTYKISSQEKIRVIPLGTNLTPFLQRQRNSGGLRQTLSLSSKTPLIGSVGRLVPVKNFSLLLDALAILRDQKQDFHFVLAGGGPSKESLVEQTARLQLTDKVSFLGWKTDLDSLYCDLDLFVLSSLNEGTPLAIIEAFASGCPVVATDVGGVKDLFQLLENSSVPGLWQGKEGFVVPSNDVNKLAEAMEFFLSHPKAMQDCGLAARETSQQFTNENLQQRLAKLYRELWRTAA